ncbi:MAG TPA: lysophospholipid acyltransferase family protein [Mycobacteriales bacterium]|nr:lysophospholipid acyltransferase family protein [Mycobacteriales bacterium]
MRARRKAGFWIRLCVVLIRPFDGLMFKLRWNGEQNVPPTGGVILAANHVSYADPLTFVRFVWDSGRIPRILIKDSLFRVPLIGAVMRGAKQIPVTRGSSTASSSLEGAVAAIEAGEALCVYPEGTVTRDPDWWPMRSRTGAARLALQTRAPVIPIAQWGAQFAYDKYNHKISLLPRKKIEITAGPPVDLSAYYDRPVTAELLREVTDVIMRAIRDELATIRGEEPPSEFFEYVKEPK